jgi:anti-sigma28 factor (negative regulator of flagellin synthesis)
MSADDVNRATEVSEAEATKIKVETLLIPMQQHVTNAVETSDVDLRVLALREAVATGRYEEDSNGLMERAQTFYSWLKSGTVPTPTDTKETP